MGWTRASPLDWILDAVIPSSYWWCSILFILHLMNAKNCLDPLIILFKIWNNLIMIKKVSSSYLSLFAMLIHGRSSFEGTRSVFNGASIRLSWMMEEASPLWKNLHNILRPPLFDEQVAHALFFAYKAGQNCHILPHLFCVLFPFDCFLFVTHFNFSARLLQLTPHFA